MSIPTELSPAGRGWVHRLTAIDHITKTGTCAACGPKIPLSLSFRTDGRERWRCSIGKVHTAARSRKKTYVPTDERIRRLERKFGISVDEYDRLLTAQSGACAICCEMPPAGKRLAVDHDHDTGAVRGLLCGKCNTGIGLLGDDPRLIMAAAAYVHSFKAGDRA